jgi:ataxia telangiectasia mutated family protein
MTILEVVIHDPLYKWSLSPVEARNKQEKGRPSSRAGAVAVPAVGAEADDGTLIGGASSNTTRRNQGDHFAGRDAAERTLMRIRNKLLGNEDSAGEGLGVEGQVEQLITAARDTKNLSRIFVGWCSWV